MHTQMVRHACTHKQNCMHNSLPDTSHTGTDLTYLTPMHMCTHTHTDTRRHIHTHTPRRRLQRRLERQSLLLARSPGSILWLRQFLLHFGPSLALISGGLLLFYL